MSLFLALLVQAPSALQAPAPQPLRAQYDWGYADAHGEGKGTLSVLVDPATGRLVLELHGLGERLVLLQGSRGEGYRVQIPRREVDRSAPDLAGLPLPFLPELKDADGLHRLLVQGQAPGVTVTRRDAKGPVKLRYTGRDDRGGEVQVWMTRTRWEPGS